MTVNGQPMTDSQGNVIGYMNSEAFALYDNTLNNSGKKMYFTLYYANEKGDKLIETRKEYRYDKSQSPELFALMLLKQGPIEEGLYRTIPVQRQRGWYRRFQMAQSLSASLRQMESVM